MTQKKQVQNTIIASCEVEGKPGPIAHATESEPFEFLTASSVFSKTRVDLWK